MSSPQAVKEAQALLRLRVMREDAAQVSLQRCREQQAECQRTHDRRVAQIASLRSARLELLDWQSNRGAIAAPRTWPYAGARLAALDDELERAEVELVDERNDLQRADHELETARQAWLHERARRQAVEQLGHDARRSLARLRELRVEREIEPRLLLGI